MRALSLSLFDEEMWLRYLALREFDHTQSSDSEDEDEEEEEEEEEEDEDDENQLVLLKLESLLLLLDRASLRSLGRPRLPGDADLSMRRTSATVTREPVDRLLRGAPPFLVGRRFLVVLLFVARFFLDAVRRRLVLTVELRRTRDALYAPTSSSYASASPSPLTVLLS